MYQGNWKKKSVLLGKGGAVQFFGKKSPGWKNVPRREKRKFHLENENIAVGAGGKARIPGEPEGACLGKKNCPNYQPYSLL